MPTNRPSARLAQLYALRAQVDALILADEQEMATDASGGCEHPLNQRRDATTMGGPRKFRCLACGQTVEGSYEG